MREDLQSTEKISNGKRFLLLVLSLVLSGAAIWYAWIRYTSLVSRSDAGWYEWIQPSLAALFGLLSFWAAVLFSLRKADALSYFKLGLSMIPLMLFANLVILLIRGAVSILQGNAGFLLDRILSQPHKLIITLIVIIALTLLGALTNTENQKAK